MLDFSDASAAPDSPAFPLVRRIGLSEPVADPVTGWLIQCDASPVGAGAILKHGGTIIEYVHHAWSPDDFPRRLGVIIGSTSWQTFFELLAIALALDLWGDWFKREPVGVVGDNTGSLTNLLKQTGKGGSCRSPRS